jgi:benzaldehyde dehydrogenase (NAD)
MTLMDEPAWRGKIFSGGRTDGTGGAPVIEQIPTGIVHINEQTVDDEPNIPFGRLGASGTGARFGGTANLEAFTDTRWVTIRGDIAPCSF